MRKETIVVTYICDVCGLEEGSPPNGGGFLKLRNNLFSHNDVAVQSHDENMDLCDDCLVIILAGLDRAKKRTR